MPGTVPVMPGFGSSPSTSHQQSLPSTHTCDPSTGAFSGPGLELLLGPVAFGAHHRQGNPTGRRPQLLLLQLRGVSVNISYLIFKYLVVSEMAGDSEITSRI